MSEKEKFEFAIKQLKEVYLELFTLKEKFYIVQQEIILEKIKNLEQQLN